MSDCEIVTNNIFSENNINKIFQNGHLLYQGYVDDPRNTDNSWMETQGKKSTFSLERKRSRYDCNDLILYFIISFQS